MNLIPKTNLVFRPEVFEVETIEQAMGISVTEEPGITTAERWVKETRYLVNDIGKFLHLESNSCVLDYGCGLGRIGKELIDRFGCRVLGVDASKAMRLLAPEYVLSERFSVCSPEVLDKLVAKGFQADFAVSMWVIQHVNRPVEVIHRIASALAPGGVFYALNGTKRCVPTDQGWLDDNFDIRAGLRLVFKEEEFHTLPPEAITPQLSPRTMIQILRKVRVQ